MNFRSPFFSILISLICGGLLFFLFRFFIPPESGVSKDGYAILAVDESQDDRFMREILARGGMESFISESSQFVPIDDFGVLKMVQLDSFHAEIEEFDPRDAGYAAEVKSFFVHDGKRFFFSSLEDIKGKGTVDLKKKLDSILEGIPYSFTVLGQRESYFWYFILLALGCAFTLFLSHSRRQFIYQLPLLLAIGWGGPSAIIFAAILSGIWELLREPLGELSAARRYERINYAGTGFKGTLERLKPFRRNLLLVLFFLFFLLSFSAAGNLPAIPAAATIVFFFFLYFLSFQVERDRVRKNRHIPFTPVLLFPLRFKTFSLFPFLLPFAAMSLLALFLPQAYSPSQENTAFIDPRYIVSADDYYRHLAFQRSFSYRSLNIPQDPLMEEAYLRYYLGDDGLIMGSTDHTGSKEGGSPRIGGPPFPLEKLMDFLINYDKQVVGYASGANPQRDATGAEFPSESVVVNEPINVLGKLKEWISVGIILAVCIMDLIRPGISSKKKDPAFGDKRVAA